MQYIYLALATMHFGEYKNIFWINIEAIAKERVRNRWDKPPVAEE